MSEPKRTTTKENSEVSRRDFISKVGITTAGLAIAGCSSSKTPFSPDNPGASAKRPPPEPTPQLPTGTQAKAKVATTLLDHSGIELFLRTFRKKPILSVSATQFLQH